MSNIFNLRDHHAFTTTFIKVATAAPLTPVQLFFRSLSKRDWTFTYSDSGSVYRAASKHLDALKQNFKELENVFTPEERNLATYGLTEFVDTSRTNFYDELRLYSGEPAESIKFFGVEQFILNGSDTTAVKKLCDIHLDIEEIKNMLNLGVRDYRLSLIYSPYMVRQSSLFKKFSDKTGQVNKLFKFIAVSSKLEKAIDNFFKTHSDKELNLYFKVKAFGSIQDTKRVERIWMDVLENNQPKPFMIIDSAAIALSDCHSHNAVVDNTNSRHELIIEYFNRQVSEKNIELAKAYLAKLDKVL